MEETSKSTKRYSEEFKLSVLKDMYENNLSTYKTVKKYGFTNDCSIIRWKKQYPFDSKLLSLSDQALTRIKTMQEDKKSTREEQLAQEVENLRKALAYSELRNEALNEVLKIGKERYGIDLLKKAGAKQ